MRLSPALPDSGSSPDRIDASVWKVLSVAVLGSFLAQMDATVVNVSLSSLAVELVVWEYGRGMYDGDEGGQTRSDEGAQPQKHPLWALEAPFDGD